MGKLGIYEYGHMIHRAWRYRLRTERDEIKFMLAQDLRGKLVVDIGANTGIYSYWMHKKVGPNGQVVGFEPQPEMIEQLHKVKHDFKLKNLQIAETGLSSSSGSVTLNRRMGHLGGASITFDVPGADSSISIPITTLDEYFADHQARPIAFIKCDVEGHEHEVFAGGMKTIEQDRPTILVESHNLTKRTSPMLEQLTGLDYSAHFFHQRKLMPIAQLEQIPADQVQSLLNYVFLPPK